MSEEGYDPITFSVILSRFDAIVEEMTRVLEKSAWTSILALAYDYSCGIYDALPRQVSMFDALPIHTTSLHIAVHEIATAFEGDINPGDVFLFNDPYSGNTHIGDYVTAAPVFSEGRLVFWSVTKGHQMDTGAYIPSSVVSSAADIYQEGITIPPMRMVEGGQMRDDFLRLLLANLRYADLVEGDLRAQVGSIEKARQRLEELCAEYGTDVLLGYVEEIIAYSSRRTGQEIASMPDGSYSAEGWIDSDGFGTEHIPVKVEVTIEGENVKAYSTASGELTDTPIFDVADLDLGASVVGPAIIAAPTTTIVLHAGDVLSRQVPEGFLIDVAAAAPARPSVGQASVVA